MTVDIKFQLRLLKKLRDIDLRVHHIDLRLKEIPKVIEGACNTFMASRDVFTTKEAEKNGADRERRGLEQELEAEVVHVRDREMRLYAIKTNKEYQATLKEIADAKKANKDREEAVLRLMEKSEQLSQEITQLSGRVTDKETEFKRLEEGLKKEAAELEVEREKDNVEREAIAKEIDKEIMRLYRFIGSRYPDALVGARNGVCMGCNMNVPPQLFLELRRYTRISQCPSCKRLLFYLDETEVEMKDFETNKEDDKKVVTS